MWVSLWLGRGSELFEAGVSMAAAAVLSCDSGTLFPATYVCTATTCAAPAAAEAEFIGAKILETSLMQCTV